MAAVSRSARLFLQRAGVRRTHRTEPVVALNNLRIRDYPTTDPPLAIYARPVLGNPPPDRGESAEWPPQGSTTDGG